MARKERNIPSEINLYFNMVKDSEIFLIHNFTNPKEKDPYLLENLIQYFEKDAPLLFKSRADSVKVRVNDSDLKITYKKEEEMAQASSVLGVEGLWMKVQYKLDKIEGWDW